MNLNTIGGLESIYQFQNELKLNKTEIDWLKQQIDQIALAFYLEKNPILIRKVGGIDGCPNENVYKEIIKGKEVTILHFCFTCSGAGKLDEFIRIFNHRTDSLLK
ncbi:hypothetical protein [Flavobacterium johnsoniae]|uniref:hypothetical protein n=1 Tax=Flavobacterium johnsoniae TaxID=986 RepID=UPI000F4D5027|nr:hypothetical protein [Flavobacterium johnsoniae]